MRFQTIGFLLFLICNLVHSQDVLPILQKSFPGKHIEVIEGFNVPEVSMTGYVVRTEGITTIVYLNSSRSSLFVGNVFDSNGKNITIEHIKERQAYFGFLKGVDMEKTPRVDKIGLYSKLKLLEPSKEGSNKFFIVYDRNCPHCTSMFEALSKVDSRITNKISWVPVNVLDPRNGLDINAKDILDKNAFSDSKTVPDRLSKEKVIKNTLVLKKHIENKVPTILVVKDDKVSVIPGMPINDIVATLASQGAGT